MALNNKYFNLVATRDTYHLYQPLGNPLILFSNIDGFPLAALHLRCVDENGGRALIAKRHSGDTDFQGLINRDNQEFELVISNLTSQGMINFNIMHNDSKVVDVDPGTAKGGLNQVNELKPYESYAIRCDQKDNLSLILKTVTNKQGEKIALGDQLAAGLGTKYYLSVVPQVNIPELEDKFSDTYWACVDVLVIKNTCRYPTFSDYSLQPGITYALEGLRPLSHNSRVRKALESPIAQCSISESVDDMIEDSSVAAVTGGKYVQVNSETSGKTYNFDRHSVKCTLGLSVNERLTFADPPNPTELLAIGDGLVKSYEEKIHQNYRNQLQKIYEEKQCVICLDDQFNPNVIFYACGHKCCHAQCLGNITNCPVCRLHITAKLIS